MLWSVSVGVHFVDIDTRDSRILRVIVEQVQEIHVCPHVIADCDDAVDDNASAGAFARDLIKKLPQRYRTVWNERVVLDVCRTNGISPFPPPTFSG
jgi:hypothetical protein